MKKNVGSFVLGLIGGIIGIFGGLYVAVCAEFADGVGDMIGESTNYALFAWVFGVGAAILGIVGGAMAMSNAFKGAIVLLASVIFYLIAMIAMSEFIWVYFICAVMFGIGSLIGFLTKETTA